MKKDWQLQPKVPQEFLGQFPNFNLLQAQLLYNRGLIEAEQISDFLNPKYENLHNPFLFLEMQKAVDRVWEAIDKNQKICIYGDYDADAVTANAVLQQTFKHLGVEVLSYIPDRFTEGYGINLEAVSNLKDQEVKLVITVDCGTNSTEVADWCRQNGIDLIITDHHEIIGNVPQSYALINPKNPNDNYPYSEITGVGVAFKFACAILKNPKSDPSAGGQNPKLVPGWEKWLLDLVAIGTVADCHSLLGENRILVKYGLQVLSKTKWPGLRALIQSSGLKFETRLADTYALGFVLAPRLNAAGRLEHANIALHLLMESDPIKSLERAAALEEINRRRQDLTAGILSEAREQALKYQDRKVLVLLGKDWPKGVVGLVAGRIAEEFNKPAIVLDRDEDKGSTGSARTAGNFNLVEALKFASEHLIKFGGHKQAAGLTLKTAEYEAFYAKILEYAEANIGNEDLKSVLFLEAELNESQLSVVNCKLLEQFGPFGVDNHQPKFLIKNLLVKDLKLVGALQQHLQLKLEASNKIISAIMFKANNFAKTLKIGDTVEVSAELICDSWNGTKQLKLRIIDVRLNKN